MSDKDCLSCGSAAVPGFRYCLDCRKAERPGQATKDHIDGLAAAVVVLGEDRERYRKAAELLRFELIEAAGGLHEGAELDNVRRALAVTAWLDVAAEITRT